jgi:segregation and condensation protein B
VTKNARSRRGPTVEKALARVEAAFAAPAPAPGQEANDRADLDPAVLRAVEAMLFAAPAPLSAEDLAARLPAGADAAAAIAALERFYQGRGVTLTAVAGKWRFQTAPDLAHHFAHEVTEPKKLPRAALETLAVIAYHQPVTRAEIEEIRGVSLARGALDLLIEIGWVRPRGRRRTPGRPLTFATTDAFLAHFGLPALDALPGKDDLQALGALPARMGSEIAVPRPGDVSLHPEDPLDSNDESLDFFVDHLDKSES